MKLTNDSYVILMGTRNFTERYYRDEGGWLKRSARGRKLRMSAEQVLNHLLPALAGMKPNLVVKVEHHEPSPSRMSETRKPKGSLQRSVQGANRVKRGVAAAVYAGYKNLNHPLE
jgi:hypothetical protein